jgi:Cu(I)/Ag(I) efflux system membrane fusion protein
MNLVKKVTEGQSVESHSIDHLYDQLISLWWGLSNYNSKDTAISSEIKLPVVAYDLIHQ